MREKTRNVSRSRAGVAFFSSFVVKRVRVENSFFLFELSDRWSLVWRRRGFQMAKREGSRIFHHVSSAFEGRPLLEGRGGLHFIFLLCEEGVQCVFV